MNKVLNCGGDIFIEIFNCKLGTHFKLSKSWRSHLHLNILCEINFMNILNRTLKKCAPLIFTYIIFSIITLNKTKTPFMFKIVYIYFSV